MAKFDPLLNTLEAHNSAGNGFTSLKPSAFNRQLNSEKKSFSFLLAFPQTPLRGAELSLSQRKKFVNFCFFHIWSHYGITDCQFWCLIIQAVRSQH